MRVRGVWLAAAVAVFACGGPLPAAQDVRGDLLREAGRFEQQGQWEKALDAYEQLPPGERRRPEVRDRYRACLRHAQQARRFRDPGYRQQAQGQDLRLALRLYAEVLAKLRANYVDRDRADPNELFRHGLDELRQALDDDLFCHQHLPGVPRGTVRAWQRQLAERRDRAAVHSVREAQAEAFEIALAAQREVRLRPAVTVLELVCGACDGLDEYTAYLTAGQLGDVYAALAGEFVGVGVELEAVNRRLLVAQVVPGSPAAQAGVKAGDWVSRIDKKAVDPLAPEAEAERLRGEAGSVVELDIVAALDAKPRTVRLVRQAVNVPSVVGVQMVDEPAGVGYCHVTGFQRTTLQELDDALLQLKMRGMKALVLDLRGNPGGLFEPAVQACERFLTDGVIVSTQSQVREHNRVYRASNPGALALPLVVLIDGETASAAEIVAGALKDNGRATLVGQPTFGKGSIQRVLQLETVRAGIRVTLAKFFSPSGQAYAGNGVTPHVAVEGMADSQLQIAVQEAVRLTLMGQ